MLASSFSLLTVLAPAYCTSIERTIGPAGATGPVGALGAGLCAWSERGVDSTAMAQQATTTGTNLRKFMKCWAATKSPPGAHSRRKARVYEGLARNRQAGFFHFT